MPPCNEDVMQRRVINPMEEQDPAIIKLMAAVVDNNHRKVDELLRTGIVSVDAIDVQGFTALMYACNNGFFMVVDKLTAYGVDVNYRHPVSGNTALHLAAQAGHTRTVELLVRAGADKQALNGQGKTAYGLASNSGHGENMVMRQLLAHATLLDANNNHQLARTDSLCSLKTIIGEGVAGEIAKYRNKPSNHGKRALRRSRSDDRLHDSMPRAETIPARSLLEIFSKTGIYYLMSSGYGYALLHLNLSSPSVLFEEVSRNLDMNNPTIMQLMARLKEVYTDFDRNDHLLDNVNVCQAHQIVNQAGHITRRLRHRRLNPRQQQGEEELVKANAIVYYVNWKKQNQAAIARLICQLEMRLANVVERQQQQQQQQQSHLRYQHQQQQQQHPRAQSS